MVQNLGFGSTFFQHMTHSAYTFDAIIIGSGQGGNPLAKKLAGAGLQTALIEKGLIGGTCINVGCTPTKTMIADAKLAFSVREAPSRGISTGEISIDIRQIIHRKNGVVKSFRESSEKGLNETKNLTVLKGEASFTGPKQIKVITAEGVESTYTAEKIFINTGCSPTIPSLEGLDKVPFFSSTTLLDIQEIPQHLIVLGGGDIALELGQLFSRLGATVSIIERGKALLSKEDDDVQSAIQKILEEEGLHVYTDTKVERVSTDGSGHIQMDLIHGGQKETLTGSHLLVATGRSPQTVALDTDKTGITLDERGFIQVNEYLETNVPGIYALGDVKGGPAFTHISYNDYVILYKNLLENKKLSVKDRQIPYCVFTDPQLGRIGLTEKAARAQGYSVATAVLPMDYVARAIETGHTKGMMKAVVDTGTRQILGVAFLGEEGGEMMTAVQMAMMGGITYDGIRDMVIAHPLFCEAFNNLFAKFD